jgi:hypothetical protein
VTTDQLTALLAENVMHWRVGPERFLMDGRRWLPRWKFQPVQKLTDAIRLLEAAKPEAYSVAAEPNGTFCARVSVSGVTAEGHARTKPLAICLAVAAVAGIAVNQ